MKILGLIPARSGSKGVAGKNTKLLGGLPLLAHTIRTAREADCLDRLWVSTDDRNTADIAEKYGVAVPWLRPVELAQDGSALSDVLVHLLEKLGKDEGYKPDAILILQPTSPFRKMQTIRKAVEMHQKYNGETVISVTPARSHPYWCYRINHEILEPFLPRLGIPPPRQECTEVYVLDGSIYLISRTAFLKNRSFYGDRDHPLVIPPEEAIDIDTPFDWMIAESLWKII